MLPKGGLISESFPLFSNLPKRFQITDLITIHIKREDAQGSDLALFLRFQPK